MRKKYELITSKELPDYLNQKQRDNISFGITMSNKKVFKVKPPEDKSTDKVREDYKGKSTLKVLTITNQNKTKHLPIVKKRADKSNEVKDVYLIKASGNLRKFESVLKKKKRSKDSEVQDEEESGELERVFNEFYTTYDEFD